MLRTPNPGAFTLHKVPKIRFTKRFFDFVKNLGVLGFKIL
jgi:hypothetical protein